MSHGPVSFPRKREEKNYQYLWYIFISTPFSNTSSSIQVVIMSTSFGSPLKQSGKSTSPGKPLPPQRTMSPQRKGAPGLSSKREFSPGRSPGTSSSSQQAMTMSMLNESQFGASYPRFVGRLQRTNIRKQGKPPVDFAKGGSDFRTPHNTTVCIGRQVLYESAPSTRMNRADRFFKSDTVGIGPAGTGQLSSMRRQVLSQRRSAGNMNFGTSIRDDELKQYSLYTSMRR